MNNYLFDFDGTLFNTSPGIFNSMEQVCRFYNLPYKQDTFVKMIGPSLKESFSTVFHLPESEIQNAITVFRKYYSEKGMLECSEYEGVFDVIRKLKNAGKKVFVATSKPENMAKKILKNHKYDTLFDFIGGSDLDENLRVEKVDVINYVLNQNNLLDKKNDCLMIGDRNYDIFGAKKCGLKSCGVLWGFGSKKEFENADADFIISKPEEILDL